MPKICPLLTIASCAISTNSGGPEGKKLCEEDNCEWYVWIPGEGARCAAAANSVIASLLNQRQY